MRSILDSDISQVHISLRASLRVFLLAFPSLSKRALPSGNMLAGWFFRCG
jgi:hypothetical protein